MPPLTLPSHLSHKSSLVLIPISSIQEPIQTLRRKHDKHFRRWPPHVNLIYPFLSSPLETVSSISAKANEEPANQEHGSPLGGHQQLRSDVSSRLRKSVRDIKPFTIALSANPPGVFEHGKKSASVWLRPVDLPADKDGNERLAVSTAVKDLQSALQSEFSECDADERSFTAHLSIGQAPGAKAARKLSEETESTVKEFLDSSGEPLHAERNGTGLVWHVDRIFVIEREGFHDPFRIIGEVELGGRANYNRQK